MTAQLTLDLTHQLAPNRRWSEIRFDASAPLSAIRAKIARHVGSKEEYIRIQLCQDEDQNEGPIFQDLERSLADYGVVNRNRLHIYDDDPQSLVAELADDTAGPLYRMSDEDYNKRSGNAKDFLRQLKQLRPELFQKKAEEKEITVAELSARFPLTTRCQFGETTSLRGSVAWRGHISDTLKNRLGVTCRAAVAIKLDTPVGNWDGKDGEVTLVEGADREFHLCAFDQVRIGDYPELDPFDQDEI